MSDQRENLPVCADGNGDCINITAEELQGLWAQYLEKDDDVQEGEFTKQEAASMWGVPMDTAYDRLERMVQKGMLNKRAGRRLGKKVTFYRKI